MSRSSIFAGGLDTIGERIVRMLLENLDKSDHTPLVMLTRSAPTDAQSEALLTVARYIMRLEPIASSSTDELVERFGPVVQHCLTGRTASP